MAEGTAADALKGALQFAPYVKFQVQQVLSLAEAGDVMKAMAP